MTGTFLHAAGAMGWFQMHSEPRGLCHCAAMGGSSAQTFAARRQVRNIVPTYRGCCMQRAATALRLLRALAARMMCWGRSMRGILPPWLARRRRGEPAVRSDRRAVGEPRRVVLEEHAIGKPAHAGRPGPVLRECRPPPERAMA